MKNSFCQVTSFIHTSSPCTRTRNVAKVVGHGQDLPRTGVLTLPLRTHVLCDDTPSDRPVPVARSSPTPLKVEISDSVPVLMRCLLFKVGGPGVIAPLDTKTKWKTSEGHHKNSGNTWTLKEVKSKYLNDGSLWRVRHSRQRIRDRLFYDSTCIKCHPTRRGPPSQQGPWGRQERDVTERISQARHPSAGRHPSGPAKDWSHPPI